jgi:hypothetical protein
MKSADHPDTGSESVSLANEEAVKPVLLDSVFGLWNVVNNLTRLKPSRRDRYRVTILDADRAKSLAGSLTNIRL